jgi:hypothetical protein
MSDPIVVNGNQYSWGSITFKLDNVLYTGFTSIQYADKRERVMAYGMGRHQAPRGRSRGKYAAENTKVAGWKKSVQLLRAALAARATGGKSYGDVEFQGLVCYFEEDEGEMNVTLERLTWAANNAADEESADPLKEDFELSTMYIARNGLVLFDQSQVVLV